MRSRNILVIIMLIICTNSSYGNEQLVVKQGDSIVVNEDSLICTKTNSDYNISKTHLGIGMVLSTPAVGLNREDWINAGFQIELGKDVLGIEMFFSGDVQFSDISIGSDNSDSSGSSFDYVMSSISINLKKQVPTSWSWGIMPYLGIGLMNYDSDLYKVFSNNIYFGYGVSYDFKDGYVDRSNKCNSDYSDDYYTFMLIFNRNLRNLKMLDVELKYIWKI